MDLAQIHVLKNGCEHKICVSRFMRQGFLAPYLKDVVLRPERFLIARAALWFRLGQQMNGGIQPKGQVALGSVFLPLKVPGKL